MGTLTIIEYSAVGSDANRDAPVPDLRTIIATTVDSSTSGTASSHDLNKDTRLVRVFGAEEHRLSWGSDTTTTAYDVVGTSKEEFGVKQGGTIYYRTDA